MYIDPLGLLVTGRNDVSRGHHATGSNEASGSVVVTVNGHAVVAGVGGAIGVIIDSDGRKCYYVEFNLSFGPGIFAGAGVSVSGSSGVVTPGYATYGSMFVDVAAGPAAGAAVTSGDSGIGGVKGTPAGVGSGAATGVRKHWGYSFKCDEPEGCQK